MNLLTPSKGIGFVTHEIEMSVPSDKQDTFLKKYFVNYDPHSRTFNLDFSKVKSHRLLLMGDCYQSLILQKVQNEFFSLFVESPTACLLANLLPTYEIKKDQYPYWKQFPDQLRLFGADVTGLTDSEYLINENVLHQNNLIRLDSFKKFKITYQKIAGLFHTQLSQEKIRIEKDHVQLFNCTLSTQWNEIVAQFNQENPINTGGEEAQSPAIRISNQGLFEAIKRHDTSSVTKIVSIWGMLRLIDEELVDQLKRNHISYSILMPNARLMEAINLEYTNCFRKAPMMQLELRSRNLAVYREIPRNVQSLFCSAIQNLLKSSEQKSFYLLNIETLVGKIKVVDGVSKKGRWTFPAKVPFQLKGISSSDYIDLVDKSEIVGKNLHLKNVNQNVVLRLLTSIINKELLFHRVALLKVKLAEHIWLENHFSPQTLETSILFGSEQPFSFIVGKGTLITTATYLFSEMKRRGLQNFHIPAHQPFVFTDITEIERQECVNDINAFNTWLASKAPVSSQIRCLGEEISVQSLNLYHPQSVSAGDVTTAMEQVNGISLMAKSGLTFKCVSV